MTDWNSTRLLEGKRDLPARRFIVRQAVRDEAEHGNCGSGWGDDDRLFRAAFKAPITSSASRALDANNGTQPGRTVLTIQKGVDALKPGDTLTIGPGEYFENVQRTDLGSLDVDTVIRAEVPGTARAARRCARA